MTLDTRKDTTEKFRMDAVTLELMNRARRYANLDKSKFIRYSIREKAEAILAEHEKTYFTQEDWQHFFALLEQPPAPTERMRKAAKKYKDITANHAI